MAGDRTAVALSTMSVKKNIGISALQRWCNRVGIISVKAERASCTKFLEMLAVTTSFEVPISSLSGGNQQRALVGRIIAADVDVVIHDEPTVGVDIHAREALWQAIRDLAADKVVIVASSEPEELVALCHSVVCLVHGRVAAVLDDEALTMAAITEAVT